MARLTRLAVSTLKPLKVHHLAGGSTLQDRHIAHYTTLQVKVVYSEQDDRNKVADKSPQGNEQSKMSLEGLKYNSTILSQTVDHSFTTCIENSITDVFV